MGMTGLVDVQCGLLSRLLSLDGADGRARQAGTGGSAWVLRPTEFCFDDGALVSSEKRKLGKPGKWDLQNQPNKTEIKY